MEKASVAWVRKGVFWATSLAAVATGACFIWGCTDIYYAGKGFFAAAVYSHFSSFSFLVYIWLTLISAGVVLSLLYPQKERAYRGDTSPMVLKNLYKKAGLITDPAVVGERKKRGILTIISAILCLAALAVFLVYGLDSGNYSKDLNGSVKDVALFALYCFAFPFAWALYTAYANKASRGREIGAIKAIMATEGFVPAPFPEKKDINVAPYVRTALIILAVLAIYEGISGGAVSYVLTKAVNICTECIGLG